MTKKKLATRPVGRPPLNLPTKPRHFLQVERTPKFDADLLKARMIISDITGTPLHQVTKTDAVKTAISLLAAKDGK